MKITGTPAQLKMFVAFGKLLQSRPINQVSITSIIKAASINRSTFYLYYSDIDAFVNDLENRLLDYISDKQSDQLRIAIEATSREPSFDNAYPVFLSITRSIKDNFQLFQALTSPNGDSAFIEKLELSMGSTLFANLSEVEENEEFFAGVPADYAVPMFFSSILTVIKHWLKKDKPESAEFVAKLITRTRYVSPYQLFKR